MNIRLQEYAATILRGEKVRLRALREEDLSLLTSWWNDPAWMALQNISVAPMLESSTVEKFRAWSSNKDASSYGFSIEALEANALVGHVTLWGIDPKIRAGTLSIMIGSPHIDKGFGTDAVRAMLRFAFEELGINKVELGVWEYNTRGLKVYERLGFKIEGTRRAAAFHAGKYWAQIQMGILKNEYMESR